MKGRKSAQALSSESGAVEAGRGKADEAARSAGITKGGPLGPSRVEPRD